MTPDELKNDADWQEVFKYADATDCRTRKQGKKYQLDEVSEVIATVEGENDGAEWCGLFRMSDGRFLVIRAGCDYTGWGCQESGSSDVADDLETAMAFGLTQDERARLFPETTRKQEGRM
jgi:hypothetical protein